MFGASLIELYDKFLSDHTPLINESFTGLVCHRLVNIPSAIKNGDGKEMGGENYKVKTPSENQKRKFRGGAGEKNVNTDMKFFREGKKEKSGKGKEAY